LVFKYYNNKTYNERYTNSGDASQKFD